MKCKIPARRDRYKLLSCSQGLLFGSTVILWSTINWCSSIGEGSRGKGKKRQMHIKDFFATEMGNMNIFAHEQQLVWNTTHNSEFLFSRKRSSNYKNYRKELLIWPKSPLYKRKTSLAYSASQNKTRMKINITIH